MITKVTLKNVASYKHEAILQTDKRINLLYGLNGTGKSTFSEYLYNQSAPRFSDCSIEGVEEGDKILVYNQKFVQDIFYEPQGIHGIFTLSKGNAAAQKAIDDAKNNINRITEQRNVLREKEQKIITNYEKVVENYKKQIWKIKAQYSGENRSLEFCLEGFRGNKDVLFNYLVSLENPKGDLAYSIEELKKEAESLQGDLQSKSEYPLVKLNVDYIEQSNLLKKVIVGNEDSSVASLIKDLGNSDWVNSGINYIRMHEGRARCPFCQQDTITEAFVEKLREYFDKNYIKDIEEIKLLLKQYAEEVTIVVDYLDKIKKDVFFVAQRDGVESLIDNLKSIVENNKSLLKDKIATPSIQITLESIAEYEKRINDILIKIGA